MDWIKKFVLAFRGHWFAAMSGGFSVPFAFAAGLASSYVQYILAALAFFGAWFAGYMLWKAERQRVDTLEGRLTPKINLFLHSDPSENTAGIEHAKGASGQALPYIQVSAEALTDAAVEQPSANIVRIDHRPDVSAPFSEVMGETQIADWSTPTPRLGKRKQSRINICWYDASGLHDATPKQSFKLAQAYQEIGKKGEYRYRVYVDGYNVIPTEAYLFVKWRSQGHPEITLEPIP